MMKRDFLSINDWTTEELKQALNLAGFLKKIRRTGRDIHPLGGKSMAMIFEKPSLRTRATFELAMVELGGHAVELQSTSVLLGKRESVADVARNLDRWVDICIARVFANLTVLQLARNMSVPVVNALCDKEHPCQALADLQTIIELSPGKFPRVKIAYVGDGNNVCHSLMLLATVLGCGISVATPEGYEPGGQFVSKARENCLASGGKLELLHSPQEAVKSADFVYTDVWASMGQEQEQEQRKRVFRPYQVNSDLLGYAPGGAYVLHCLPAHRGEEITDEVIDGPASRVFDQAENRLHAQKAIILKLLAPEIAEKVLESE